MNSATVVSAATKLPGGESSLTSGVFPMATIRAVQNGGNPAIASAARAWVAAQASKNGAGVGQAANKMLAACHQIGA